MQNLQNIKRSSDEHYSSSPHLSLPRPPITIALLSVQKLNLFHPGAEWVNVTVARIHRPTGRGGLRIFSREGNKEGVERSEQVYWREDRREGGVRIQGEEETKKH